MPVPFEACFKCNKSMSLSVLKDHIVLNCGTSSDDE